MNSKNGGKRVVHKLQEKNSLVHKLQNQLVTLQFWSLWTLELSVLEYVSLRVMLKFFDTLPKSLTVSGGGGGARLLY